MRLARSLPVAFALLLTVAPAAAAATPDEAAEIVADFGFYIEDGVDADLDSISEAVSRARNGGLRFSVVLLDEAPPGGETAFADAVLDRVGGGTVLVLSDSGEGMASTELDRPLLESALDAGFGAGGGDEGYVDAAVDSLLESAGGGQPVTTVASGDGGRAGGGGAGLILLLVIVGGLVLIVFIVVSRSRRRERESGERSVAGARKEIKSQLDAMANLILEISDQVSASETRQDNTYLEQASATFSEALEGYEAASDLRSLEAISDRLDEARWQLDAAKAIVSGEEPPPEPKREERHACFFDPTHTDASETAELETAAGTKKVRVCKDDAEKLRRGQRPEPRLIDVGGRRVPAPEAPRSHGGGGFGALDIFSVLAGGMGQAASYDWGGASTRGRSTRSRRRTQTRTTPPPAPQPPSTRQRAGRKRRRRR